MERKIPSTSFLGARAETLTPLLQAFVQPRGIVPASGFGYLQGPGDGFHFPESVHGAERKSRIGNPALEGDRTIRSCGFNNSFTLPEATRCP